MQDLLKTVFVLIGILLIIPSFIFIANHNLNPHSNIINTVEMYKVLDHKTSVVMLIPANDYIKGVVAAEMPISFNIESLKAQAVAAHTYAIRQIDNERKNPTKELLGATLTTDSSKNQAYIDKVSLQQKWGKNYDTNYKKLSEAVDCVINKVITYNNAPIVAAFHSISAGKTESASNVWGQDLSYLTPVISEGDKLSKNFSNTLTLTADEITSAIKKDYPNLIWQENKANWFKILSRSESDTVTEVMVGNQTLSGKKLREILGLKSPCFTVAYSDNNFTFTTNGYGHLVGMSQYGADYMARQGSTYIDILQHYYKGTIIEDIADKTTT